LPGTIPFLLAGSAEDVIAGSIIPLILLSCPVVAVARPRWRSASLAIVAGIAWLFRGILVQGLGC
jgi:hypothetical protein